ncbi:hypothetical protein RB195_003848 [Necator americanus]|uniref:Uncharacterized protein n=1 Tax=Necator americanus TaxID=51031 RepID=A0ABR1DQJ2_NECAM
MHLIFYTCLVVLVLAQPESDRKNSNSSEKQGNGPLGRYMPWIICTPWTSGGKGGPNGNNTDDNDKENPRPEGILIKLPCYGYRNPWCGGGNGFYPWFNYGYRASWPRYNYNLWNPWSRRYSNSQPTGRRQNPSKRRGNGNTKPGGPLEHMGDGIETGRNSFLSPSGNAKRDSRFL